MQEFRMALCFMYFAFIFQCIVCAFVYPFIPMPLNSIMFNSMRLAMDVVIVMTVFKEEARLWYDIIFRRPS